LVFPHPYFALTGDDGEFAIKQVPKGSYRLVVRQFDTFIHVRGGKAYCGKQNESMAIEIKKATSFDVSRVTVSCGR
jgi:hypothetical protein